MRNGHVDQVTRAYVSGWAADDASPDEALRVDITINGESAGVVIADRARADLAELGRYGAGRHGFRFEFASPLSPDFAHRVIVRHAESEEVLPNGTQFLAAEALPPVRPRGLVPRARPERADERDADIDIDPGCDPDSPAPILVAAPSRSGTTYLMSCLAAADDIVAARVMPYETRLLAYYGAAQAVLGAPADLEKSTHPDQLGSEKFHIGFNPFTAPRFAAAFTDRAPMEELFAQIAPDRLGETMASIVREYYRRLAADQGKAPVRYFAEKNINLYRQTRHFARRHFAGLREIAVVRDPRDILCSHIAYYARNPEKSLNDLTHSCRQLTQMQEDGGADICFIRYEDMIGAQADCFARLSDFLGVTVCAVPTTEDDGMFQRHGTSDSPAASIGRWRSELPSSWREMGQKSWGAFLERFGYAMG